MFHVEHSRDSQISIVPRGTIEILDNQIVPRGTIRTSLFLNVPRGTFKKHNSG